MESPHLVTFTILTATNYNNYSFFLKPGPIWHMLEDKMQQETLMVSMVSWQDASASASREENICEIRFLKTWVCATIKNF